MVKKIITKEEFLDILKRYKEEELQREVKVYDVLDVEYDMLGPNVTMEVYFETVVDGKTSFGIFSNNELRIALYRYADELGYDLNSFQFLGGVRRPGYFIARNEPYFNGLKLKLKERDVEMTRKLKNTIK